MCQVHSIGLLWRKQSFPKWICFVGLQFLHRVFKLFTLLSVLACRRFQLLSLFTLRVNDNVDHLVEMLRDLHGFIVVNFAHKVVQIVADLVF